MSIDPEVSGILKSWVSSARKPPQTVEFGTLSRNSWFARTFQGLPEMAWNPNGKTMTGWVIYSGSDAYSSGSSSYHATPDVFLDQSGTVWDLVRTGQENCYLSASPARFEKAHLGTYVTGDRNFLQRVVDDRQPLEWHYMTIETAYSLDQASRYVPLNSLTRP